MTSFERDEINKIRLILLEAGQKCEEILNKDYCIVCHVDESEDVPRLVFSLEKIGRNDKILALPSDYEFDVIMPTNVDMYPEPEEYVKTMNDPNNETFVNQYRKFLEEENYGNINVPIEKIVESSGKLIDKKNEKTIKEMEKFKKVTEKETFVNHYRKFLEEENSGNINVPIEKIVESSGKLIDEKTIKEMEKFKKVTEEEKEVINSITKISGETEDRYEKKIIDRYGDNAKIVATVDKTVKPNMVLVTVEKETEDPISEQDKIESANDLKKVIDEVGNRELDETHELTCSLDLTAENPTVKFGVKEKDSEIKEKVDMSNVGKQLHYLQCTMNLVFEDDSADLLYGSVDTIKVTNSLKKLYRNNNKNITIKVVKNKYYEFDKEMSDPVCLQLCNTDNGDVLDTIFIPKFKSIEFFLEPNGLKVSIDDIEVKQSYISWLQSTPELIKEKYGAKFSEVFQRIMNFANIGLMIQEESKETDFDIVLEHDHKLKVVIGDIAVKLAPEQWGVMSKSECLKRYGSKFADKFDIIKSRLYYSRFGKVS